MKNQPTGTEAKVCELIAKRQQLGIAKYGTTVAQNPLTLRQWLQHGLEEALDLAVYLQRSIEELDASGVGGQVAQASSGAGRSGPSGPSGPCLNDLVDRTKGAVGAMRSIVGQIESGNRQVVSIRVATSLGDALAYPNGLAFSEKVSIELELCK